MRRTVSAMRGTLERMEGLAGRAPQGPSRRRRGIWSAFGAGAGRTRRQRARHRLRHARSAQSSRARRRGVGAGRDAFAVRGTAGPTEGCVGRVWRERTSRPTDRRGVCRVGGERSRGLSGRILRRRARHVRCTRTRMRGAGRGRTAFAMLGTLVMTGRSAGRAVEGRTRRRRGRRSVLPAVRGSFRGRGERWRNLRVRNALCGRTRRPRATRERTVRAMLASLGRTGRHVWSAAWGRTRQRAGQQGVNRAERGHTREQRGRFLRTHARAARSSRTRTQEAR